MSDFRWINKQGVESAQGFVVQFTGRFTAEYREDGRVLVVDIESSTSAGLPAVCYSRSAFTAWRGSAEEQQRVASNFRDAVVFQGLAAVAD